MSKCRATLVKPTAHLVPKCSHVWTSAAHSWPAQTSTITSSTPSHGICIVNGRSSPNFPHPAGPFFHRRKAQTTIQLRTPTTTTASSSQAALSSTMQTSTLAAATLLLGVTSPPVPQVPAPRRSTSPAALPWHRPSQQQRQHPPPHRPLPRSLLQPTHQEHAPSTWRKRKPATPTTRTSSRPSPSSTTTKPISAAFPARAPTLTALPSTMRTSFCSCRVCRYQLPLRPSMRVITSSSRTVARHGRVRPRVQRQGAVMADGTPGMDRLVGGNGEVRIM